MNYLRVKDFRSIADSGEIMLRPITVFLGKNSCGKSSFIRLLPLIKQSLERNRQEPLLWYGDYVDYGDFKNILPHYKNGKTDSFELGFEIKINPSSSIREYLFFNINPFEYDKEKDISLHVLLQFKENYIPRVCISYFDQTIVLDINNTTQNVKVIINEKEQSDIVFRAIQSKNYLLPMISDKRLDRDQIEPLKDYMSPKDELVNYIKSKIANRVSSDNIWKEIRELIKIKSRKELLSDLKGVTISSIKKYFKDKEITDDVFNGINSRIILLRLSLLIERINVALHDEFETVRYIKPLRASADRYYRVQGVNVENVDADGSNAPMILYNLKTRDKNKFSEWCKEKLGISFSVKGEEGHASLGINTSDDNWVNLADTGYGYSQVLPILLQLWLFSEHGEKKAPDCTLIIEQPELHLHPAFQSKLMEIFVSLISAIREKNGNIKIIFETHSDTMINRLGSLISSNKIGRDDVNVVLVEKTGDKSHFKQVQFNEKGYIEDWPIGFMSPEA